MTPGDFEVENVALAPDRREVVFNSNQDDTDRRHLWREAAGATRPTRVTSGQGIEWSPVVMSDGHTSPCCAPTRDGRRGPRWWSRWGDARPCAGVDAQGFSRPAVG